MRARCVCGRSPVGEPERQLGLPTDFVGSSRPMSLAWSGDSKLIAVGGQDRRLTVYEAATGQVTRELGEATLAPQAVAFAADGRFVAAASGDRREPRDTPARRDGAGRDGKYGRGGSDGPRRGAFRSRSP